MNRERRLRWHGILLCILLANQFVGSIAKRIEFHNHEVSSYNQIIGRKFRRQACDIGSILKKDQCPANPHHRQKRFITAVLFAASIIAMLANIGFDIYLQIEGCAGIFPSIKDDVDEFERIRKDLLRRSREMNVHYTQSKNIMEYTKAANFANMGIMLEVNRIMSVTNDIMEALSPQDVNRFINKSYELKAEIKKNNETVQAYSFYQLEQSYQGIFSSWKNALIGLSPIMGMFGQLAISKLYDWYRLSKITQSVTSTSTQLATSAKARSILGVTDVKASISATAKAQQKGLQATSKLSKFAKVAGAAMSVVSIGMEIYVAIQKVKACEKQRDNARNAVKKIKPEEKEFEKTEENLAEFREELTDAYEDVISRLKSSTFLGYVNTIKNLTDNVDNPPPHMLEASQNMTIFMEQIKGVTDYDQINALQKRLDKAFSSVTYTIDCLKKKIQTLTYTQKQCSRGGGTMEKIFEFALKLFDPNTYSCTSETGHEYTSFAATETYIGERMKILNLESDCILNNGDIKTLVCSYYYQEYDNVAIGEKTGLTDSQVAYLIGKCPPGAVTPALERKLCFMKPFMNFETVKSLYSRYDQEELENVYNACVLPDVMPDPTKALICTKKKSGRSLALIRTDFNMYPTERVDQVYNECFEPEIPADIKENICELRNKHGIALSVVVHAYKLYPETKVEAVYQAC